MVIVNILPINFCVLSLPQQIVKWPGSACCFWEANKKFEGGGGNGKIVFRFFFVLLVAVRFSRVFIVASQTLCCRPRNGSSFYPTVSLAYLD